MKFNYSYPNDGICTKITLEYFGEKTPNYDDEQMRGGHSTEMFDVKSLETFIEHMKGAAKQYDARVGKVWKSNHAAFIPKLAVVQAFTCSWQPDAEKNLEALGFIKIGPFKKLKHSCTELTCWIIGADDLCKRLGYVCHADPRTIEQRGY